MGCEEELNFVVAQLIASSAVSSDCVATDRRSIRSKEELERNLGTQGLLEFGAPSHPLILFFCGGIQTERRQGCYVGEWAGRCAHGDHAGVMILSFSFFLVCESGVVSRTVVNLRLELCFFSQFQFEEVAYD